MKRTAGRGGVRSVVALVALLVTGACSTVYYSVWEKLGWEKRDLLRASVESVREDQQEVSEQFGSALERIKAIYGLDGGDLEEQYEALKQEHERSQRKADKLRERIDEVEEIAGDLFEEWDEEAEQISDAGLRARSRQQLAQTQERYGKLASAMHQSEAGLDPVLQKLQDQVLFLKHNLNAQAIGSLAMEVGDIETEIGRLIEDLQTSIRRADEFIDKLPS